MIVVDFDTLRPPFASWWDALSSRGPDVDAPLRAPTLDTIKKEMRWPVSPFGRGESL